MRSFFCWEVGGLDGFGPVFWSWLSDGLLRRPHRDGAMGASATTLPILRKINAIEIGEQVAGETPTREDLLENDFSSYRVVPGDVITVTAFDVYQPGQPVTVDRVVDQSGFVQLPEIGLVKVEGLLPEELSPSIRSAYGRLLAAPQVDAALVQPHWVPVHDQRLHLAAQRVSTVAIGPSFVGAAQPGGRHFGQRSVRNCSAVSNLRARWNQTTFQAAKSRSIWTAFWTVWKEVQTPPLARVRTRSSISTCCPRTRS